MPMYDYVCAACGAKFEELCRNGEETAPVCPQCGSADTQRQLSVPSPLKTGAFPFPAQGIRCGFQRTACVFPAFSGAAARSRFPESSGKFLFGYTASAFQRSLGNL